MKNYGVSKKLFWLKDLKHTLNIKRPQEDIIKDIQWDIDVYEYLFKKGPEHTEFERRYELADRETLELTDREILYRRQT